ncbi:hypothetical protein PR048_033749, partial [Dryococelus australis]
MAEGEVYSHLGVLTGYRTAQTPEEDTAKMRDDLTHSDQSLFAPWQKMDATWIFPLSRMQFILQGAGLRKTALG